MVHMYNVCLLHDFVATLRLSALPSALYFVQASTVTTSLTPIAAQRAFRTTKCLFYVSHFRSHFSLFLSYNRSLGRGWDPVKPVLSPPVFLY